MMNIKKPTHNFLIKTLAVILLIACTAAGLLSAGVYAYFAVESAQEYPGEYAESPLFWYTAESYTNRVFAAWRNGDEAPAFANTNFRYTITDKDTGEVLATNIAPGEKTGRVYNVRVATYAQPDPLPTLTAAPDGTPVPFATPDLTGAAGTSDTSDTMPEALLDPLPTPMPGNAGSGNAQYRTVILGATLLDPMKMDDVFLRQANLYGWAYQNKDYAFAAAILLFCVCLLLVVFLLCAAGRHSDSAEPRRSAIDRIPGDLLLAWTIGLVILIGYLAIQTLESASFGGQYLMFLLLVLTPLYVLGMLILIGFLMSVAARIKTRTLLSNTVIAWVLRLITRMFRGIGRGISTFFTSLPLVWQTAAGFAVFAIVNAICVAFAFGSDAKFLAALFFLGFNTAVFVLAIRATLDMNTLRQGGAAIAAGNTSYRIDTKKLLPAFRKHGENLNAINQGVASAVEMRMKSERMKTDLITNVSHDLKTPLTSIVNYIDLLKKEPLSETAKGYVEVLDRQAQRLRKLTADVVDASKASSGAMPVELAPTNAAEILTQSLAEYTERFAASSLTAIVETPETPLFVLADGRLLWRVFDNLLGNIVKYAMPGTRVYLTVAKDGCDAVVSLKNVSRDQLNLTADELMERFVQGDASRTGTGSGLGLSIAKSLIELQKGRFTIVIDGDLFAAHIAFPAIAACTEA